MPCHVKPTRDWPQSDPLLDQVDYGMQPYRYQCRPVTRKIASAGRALDDINNRCV